MWNALTRNLSPVLARWAMLVPAMVHQEGVGENVWDGVQFRDLPLAVGENARKPFFFVSSHSTS